MKHFNTEGPIKAQLHYYLPPLERLDLDEVLALIDAQKYFVLHAPRQTGKTSCLLALQELINREGRYTCIYCNVEVGQSAREDVEAALRAVTAQIASRARQVLQDDFLMERRQALLLAQTNGHGLLNLLLTAWAEHSAKPLVLLIDEIDTLIGDSLIAVLRQLRAGYDQRPEHFPQSVILCGVRNVRDYRIHSAATKATITGGSAFNIKAKSLRLGNFSPAEIKTLYEQHTAETGQAFAADLYPLVWELTAGQPWLVNALARQATWEQKEMRDRAQPVTVAVIHQAKEELILRRDTHLDQLADILSEERVRRVIEPILANAEETETIPPDDLQYVRDLGLITQPPRVAVTNAIYREVIPRELTWVTQEFLVQETAWYVGPDGRLKMDELLTAFQQFFREHSEHWVERFNYKEAGPQLLLQAFLQRIVNGGGRIEREYGLGRKRTDLLVIWPDPNTSGGGVQREVLELKLARGATDRVLREGLAQTVEYLDRCGAAAGHLVIFDRSPGKTWDEKIYRRTEQHAGHALEVWGM